MRMKYLKMFESFKFRGRKYQNINNIVDGEHVEYYQIPFSLGDGDGTCIYDDDKWGGGCIDNFYVYDYIKDEDIEKALKEDLSKIDISIGWENTKDNSGLNYETAYSNKNKHILRVAKLVESIKSNKPLTPISMYFDVMSYNYDIRNHIEDGNHRIRALQFLKYDFFPAYVYGSHAKLLIDYIK